jgi:formate dehydrogenase subunit gamma
MSSNVVVRDGTDVRGDEVVRYSLKERVCHWVSGFSYLYLLLSGLSLFTPYLYWIAYVLGGGPTVRFWHPWAGLVFFVCAMWMHGIWRADMKSTAEDKQWEKGLKNYVTNRDERLGPVGRFNAGQKQFYWAMYYSTLVLIVTGIIMWFPELMPRAAHGVLPVIVFLHVVAALVTIAAFMIHIYMGVFFVPGGLHGMLYGRVTANWAKAHHRLWYDKVSVESRSPVAGSGGSKGAD